MYASANVQGFPLFGGTYDQGNLFFFGNRFFLIVFGTTATAGLAIIAEKHADGSAEQIRIGRPGRHSNHY